MIDSSCQI